jgi:hypothetical protein
MVLYFSSPCSTHLNLPNHVEPADDVSKHDVFVVEPVRLVASDEELRGVCARARVGHAERARRRVLELKVLVGKLLSVDGPTTGAVVVGKVAALDHETGDDAVEGGALEEKKHLSGGELHFWTIMMDMHKILDPKVDICNVIIPRLRHGL